MKRSRLTPAQLKKIVGFSQQTAGNITQFAKSLGMARNTFKRHLQLIKETEINVEAQPNAKLLTLYELLPQIFYKSLDQTIKQLWHAYRTHQPQGYAYSQFAYRYGEWLKTIDKPGHQRLSLSPEDVDILQQWRRSNDRRYWERAVVLLDISNGTAVKVLAGKIERTPECIRSWLYAYSTAGLSGLVQKSRRTREELVKRIDTKKANLVRLLHEAPQLHGFNRTSWRLKDLASAYLKVYGNAVSVAMISVYIRQEGYVFRKARKVLTSPDPEFREKLANIQSILGSLQPDEKFFSVDEYGPFSIKMKGGRSIVKRGETKTFPQFQHSKGCLICTAALELSKNQVTHFYSRKKDTEEMIKLIDVLCQRYYDQRKLYISWDAAVWHGSKRLTTYIEEINADNYRQHHHTPLIELAPLPASAQFLNVIESVFSGLAKSVIHHSDYASVGHCQAAIDRYFRERNQHFALHPKKAGRKIWGQERTVAEFRDSHNCKDPAWR